MEKLNHFEEMAARWPSTIVAREEVSRFTGGAVSARYIANLDCAGKGPAGRLRIGRKIAYPVDELVSWLQGRTVTVKQKERRAA